MANGQGTIVEHRLDAEGADHLLLAGVNDSNFQELVRIFGIRVVLRGDHLVLSGDLDAVERSVPVVQHLVELARLRAPFDANDIARRVADEAARDFACRYAEPMWHGKRKAAVEEMRNFGEPGLE